MENPQMQYNIGWVSQAQQGDVQAFSWLYNVSYDDVFHLVYPFCKDDSEVNQIIYQSYKLAFQNLFRLQNPTQFIPWMKVMARNTAVDYLKRIRYFVLPQPDVDGSGVLKKWDLEDPTDFVPDIPLSQEQTISLIDNLMTPMPQEEQLCLALRDIEGMPEDEIARVLGTSVDGIKQVLSSARDRLEYNITQMAMQGFDTFGLGSLPFFHALCNCWNKYRFLPDQNLCTRIMNDCAKDKNGGKHGSGSSGMGGMNGGRGRGGNGGSGIGKKIALIAGIVVLAAGLITGGILLVRHFSDRDDDQQAESDIDDSWLDQGLEGSDSLLDSSEETDNQSSAGSITDANAAGGEGSDAAGTSESSVDTSQLIPLGGTDSSAEGASSGSAGAEGSSAGTQESQSAAADGQNSGSEGQDSPAGAEASATESSSAASSAPQADSQGESSQKQEENTQKGPGQVGSLKATPSGKNQVQLTWTSVAGAQGYMIYAKKNGNYAYLGETTTFTTYLDKTASDTDVNYYWVFAYTLDADGKRIPGACDYPVEAKGVCPAVTNLEAKWTDKGVLLRWTEVSSAEGYLIYAKGADGKYGFRGMTTQGTEWIDTKAVSGEKITYWVYPFHKNKDGKEVAGEEATVVLQ